MDVNVAGAVDRGKFLRQDIAMEVDYLRAFGALNIGGNIPSEVSRLPGIPRGIFHHKRNIVRPGENLRESLKQEVNAFAGACSTEKEKSKGLFRGDISLWAVGSEETRVNAQWDNSNARLRNSAFREPTGTPSGVGPNLVADGGHWVNPEFGHWAEFPPLVDYKGACLRGASPTIHPTLADP